MRIAIHSLILLFLTGFLTNAQTPHITGDVFISVKEGTFRADLTVSRLPQTTNYVIRLNSGLNVQSFRDSTDSFSYATERSYDPEKAYESFQYWFPTNDQKSRYLPHRFKVSYVGAFPVHSDSAKRSDWGDWKGNMAFTGKTLRASEQTAWYPILYDTLEDKTYQNVTFDITIHAPDAKAIYLNGSPPQYGQTARFRSDRPFPLLLFAGDFDFKKERNTYLLNTTLTKSQADVLDGWFSRIKSYYEQNLEIPYRADVTLLASTPVSKRNDWLFVTYPTIASVSPKGWLNTLVDNKTRAISDSSLLSFMAHELGHYYFGTVISPNSTLRWAFLEGMAEYISLQATRSLVGESFYQRKLKRYAGSSESIKNFIPLDEITTASQIDETYRYQYIPLLLTALEQQVGQEQVWKWLRTILGKKDPITNYAFFKNSLLESGVTDETFTAFEDKYLSSANSLPNLLTLFKSKSTAYYCWGITTEASKGDDPKKLQAFYTGIIQIKRDDNEVKRIGDQYFAYVKSHCDPANELVSSNFNRYDTLEEAQQAQASWLKNKVPQHTLKQVDF